MVKVTATGGASDEVLRLKSFRKGSNNDLDETVGKHSAKFHAG
jgi:hypothetical protein